MRIRHEAGHYYQVSREVCGVRFVVGYTEDWRVDLPGVIVLIRPFRRGIVRSRMGDIPCRAPWESGGCVSGTTHDVDPVAVEVWMLTPMEDLVEIGRMLQQIRIKLPRQGFRRL